MFPYDRLLQITSDIANGVCQQFRMEDVVCPTKLRHGLFTTGAVDNIDHNPSSATAKDSFHGTGISLMQHPSHTQSGTDRDVLVISQNGSSTKSVTPLPTAYTVVPPATLRTKEFSVPPVQGLFVCLFIRIPISFCRASAILPGVLIIIFTLVTF